MDKEPSPKRKSPPAKKAKTTRESKRKPAAKKQTKKEAPKRKRVTALFSDSSESESDEEKRDKVLRGEAMEVEEPEPEPEAQAPDFASSDEDEVVQATPKEKQTISRGKHKVKRWVEKTFLDDDGFMGEGLDCEYDDGQFLLSVHFLIVLNPVHVMKLGISPMSRVET